MEKSNVLTLGLLADARPAVIDPLNNGQGTILYNHNIREVYVEVGENGELTEAETQTEKSVKMYRYDSVRVEYPTTGDNIFSTLLSAKYPSSTESKLANEYQSAVLGLLPKDAKEPYKAFLQDRIAIRNMVDADCNTYNIPIE